MVKNLCKFKKCTKRGTEECSEICFPYVVLHGSTGDGGYWASKRTPKKYNENFLENLPIKNSNPKVYGIVKKYCENVADYVLEKNTGLFLFSIPNKNNPLGTGTGKTTTAITILNEFLVARVTDFIKDDFRFKDNPTLFLRLSEFQNIYNAQFRGSRDLTESNAEKYSVLKDRMKNVELLVIDDIGVRDLTETFKNELYEIIDYRVAEELTTIYTSNYPISKMAEFLGERTASRIEGSTYQLGFEGDDHRKKGLFK